MKKRLILAVFVAFGFVWMADCANAQAKNPYSAEINADGTISAWGPRGRVITIRDPRALVPQAGPALLPNADALKAHRAAVEQARRMRGQVPAGSQPKIVSPPKPVPVARPAQKPAETRATYTPSSPAHVAPATPSIAPVPGAQPPTRPVQTATPAYKPAETRPVPAPASAGNGEIIRYIELRATDKDTLLKLRGSGKEYLIRKGETKYAVARFNQQHQPIGSPELLDYIPPGAQPVRNPNGGG